MSGRAAAEAEVRNRLARLCYLADEGAPDEVAALTTPDATWRMTDTQWSGREEIAAGLAAVRAGGAAGPGSGTRHLLTTEYVEATSDGAASSRSRWLLLRLEEGGPEIVMAGDYTDEWRKEHGEWRLAQRTVVRAR